MTPTSAPHSCVGVFKNKNDLVEIMANAQGNRTTPSYVAFMDNGELSFKTNTDNNLVIVEHICSEKYTIG